MAKKNKIGIPEIDELLTPAERAIALTLYGIYWSQLAATDDVNSKQLKRFNYQGLYEIGSAQTDNPVIFKLKSIADSNIHVRHIFVAYGYITARF